MGGPGYSIKGEFSANGWKNPIKHERELSPWRAPRAPIRRAASSSSCMRMPLIWMASMRRLEGVVSGMEVVDEIANTVTDYSDRPFDDIVMKRVYIEE